MKFYALYGTECMNLDLQIKFISIEQRYIDFIHEEIL